MLTASVNCSLQFFCSICQSSMLMSSVRTAGGVKWEGISEKSSSFSDMSTRWMPSKRDSCKLTWFTSHVRTLLRTLLLSYWQQLDITCFVTLNHWSSISGWVSMSAFMCSPPMETWQERTMPCVHLGSSEKRTERHRRACIWRLHGTIFILDTYMHMCIHSIKYNYTVYTNFIQFIQNIQHYSII